MIHIKSSNLKSPFLHTNTIPNTSAVQRKKYLIHWNMRWWPCFSDWSHTNPFSSWDNHINQLNWAHSIIQNPQVHSWLLSSCRQWSAMARTLVIFLTRERYTEHPIKHVQVLRAKHFSFPCVTMHDNGCWHAKYNYISSLQFLLLLEVTGICHAFEEALNGTSKAIEGYFYPPALLLNW